MDLLTVFEDGSVAAGNESWHIGGRTAATYEIVRLQLWVSGNPWSWGILGMCKKCDGPVMVHIGSFSYTAYTNIESYRRHRVFFTDLWLRPSVSSVQDTKNHYLPFFNSGRSPVAEPQPVFHENQHMWSIWKWDMPPYAANKKERKWWYKPT
jgi:hypothetical protein